MKRRNKTQPKYSVDLEKQELALQSLNSNNFLVINKTLISSMGLILAGYISNLVDKFIYFQNRNELQPDGSFFLTLAEQEKQIGLSKHQLRNCKKQLIEMGILTTQMKGIPPKEFYFLHIEELTKKHLTNIGKEIRPMLVKKLNHLPIKETKYNKTKNNNKRHILSKDFDAFWLAYPKKSDKGTSKNSWNKLCNKKDKTDTPTLKQILQALEEQKETPQWQAKIIPNGATWLNQFRWLNDPEEMMFTGVVNNNFSKPGEKVYNKNNQQLIDNSHLFEQGKD